MILLLSVAIADPLPSDPLAQLQHTAQQVAAHRQLALLEPIVAVEFTEQQLAERMAAALADDYPASDVAGDTATLVIMGFAQPSLDLYQTYISVFTEQVGGFYDSDERQMFLVKRATPDLATERRVVEHELVHALQDQHFGLSVLNERPMDDSDVETALRALVEGDASFFNALSMLGEMVADPKVMPLGNGGAAVSAEEGSALAQAPDVLSRSLVSPYIDGASFVQALYADDSFHAVNRAFLSSPPLSTEQILHPDRYLSSVVDWPVAVGLPDLSAELHAHRPIDEDTLGELGMLSWLEAVGGLSVVGQPLGWGGDRYRTYQDDDGDTVFVWLSTWDTPADAERFFERAQHTIGTLHPGRWRRDGTLQAPPGALVRRSGVDVTVLVGVPRRVARAIAKGVASGATKTPRGPTSIFTSPAVTAPSEAPPPLVEPPDDRR